MRRSLRGEALSYNDKSLEGTDQLESARDFLQSIQDFVNQKVEAHVATRQRLGLSPGLSEGRERSLTSGKFIA